MTSLTTFFTSLADSYRSYFGGGSNLTPYQIFDGMMSSTAYACSMADAAYSLASAGGGITDITMLTAVAQTTNYGGDIARVTVPSGYKLAGMFAVATPTRSDIPCGYANISSGYVQATGSYTKAQGFWVYYK